MVSRTFFPIDASKWKIPVDAVDVLFLHKCRIVDCCKGLGIHRSFFYRLLKEHKEFKELFEQTKQSLIDEWLDQSEKNVWYALALGKEKPGHALKAAMYVLDRKGEPRGWNAPTANTNSANDGLLEGLINGLNDSKPKPIVPDAAEPETNP